MFDFLKSIKNEVSLNLDKVTMTASNVGKKMDLTCSSTKNNIARTIERIK